MGRIHSLLRHNTGPLLAIAGGVAAMGVVLWLVGRDLPAWPLVLVAAVVLAGATLVARLAQPSRPAPRPAAAKVATPKAATPKSPTPKGPTPKGTTPKGTTPKDMPAPALETAAAVVTPSPVVPADEPPKPPKPPKVRTSWAANEHYTPLPRGTSPLTSLVGSQAERFSIPVTPFDPTITRAGTLPSFAYKVQESIRTKFSSRHVGGRLRILLHDRKDDGYAFARQVGVEVPYIYADGIPMADLDWSSLPERVVVKPLQGAASRGVFLLEQRGEGRYFDHMNGTEITVDEVIARHRALVQEGRTSDAIVAEEFLMPHPTVADLISIPDDLKVFTFYDYPAVIMQRRCFGSKDLSQFRFRFWDAEWNDLGPVKYADRIDPHMAPPALAEEVTDVVRRLGKALAVPFARIDVYETARGVVFGEITPHPGPPAGWRADLDRLLGYEWEIAQMRVAADERPTIIPRDD